MAPNSTEKKHAPACGPIRAAYTTTSRTKIAVAIPAITSALQGTRRKREYLFEEYVSTFACISLARTYLHRLGDREM